MDLSRCNWIERYQMLCKDLRADASKGSFRTDAVGSVVYKWQDEPYFVSVGLLESLDLPPTEFRSLDKPWVIDLVLVEQPGNTRRRQQRAGRVVLRVPPRRTRVGSNGGKHKRHPT